MKRVKILFLPFPEAVRGVVYGLTTEVDADNYIVAINDTTSPIVQRHALGHELAHVDRDHFRDKRSLIEVEREANKLAWQYYRCFRDGLLTDITICDN